MARYNYATAIKSLMVKDYEENGKKIREQIGGMIKTGWKISVSCI